MHQFLFTLDFLLVAGDVSSQLVLPSCVPITTIPHCDGDGAVSLWNLKSK